jgi:hypothetical protein
MIPDNLQLDCSLGDTGMRKMSALSEVETLIVPRTTSVEAKVAFLRRKNIIFLCPKGGHTPNRFCECRGLARQKIGDARSVVYTADTVSVENSAM